MILGQFVLMIALGIYGFWGTFHPSAFSILDGANILFHEAGHLVFGILGNYIGIWGGTLMQLLMPAGIGLGFLAKKEPFSSAVMFFWLGENLIPMAHYIRDSRAQVLPFIGGEIHDWNYILSSAHLLEYDQGLGNFVQGLGFLVMMAAVFMGARDCWLRFRKT